MIRVITLKSHTLDGATRHQVGEAYETTEFAAKLLVAQKLVRYEDRKRNEYKRRDLRAER